MIGLIKSVLGTTPDQCYHIYSCLKSTSTCVTHSNIQIYFGSFNITYLASKFGHMWDIIVFYLGFLECHRKWGVHNLKIQLRVISKTFITKSLVNAATINNFQDKSSLYFSQAKLSSICNNLDSSSFSVPCCLSGCTARSAFLYIFFTSFSVTN